MTLELFAHPFSSYCQKALIALYENDTPFTLRMLEDPGVGEEFAALWPMKRFPILRENGRVVLETSTIIEYLHVHHPG
ncbi:MAG: glutathione S-transferase family protein, partial [Caulobacteraceae bacterium]